MLTATYLVAGPEPAARATASQICLDQTIEADAALLSPSLRAGIVGRLEALNAVSPDRYEAVVTYPSELVGRDCSDLLNLLFGTSSLRPGVRLAAFTLSPELLARWRGPRFGPAGLRKMCGVPRRPLICAVLKPLGRSPDELARLALQFVLGGVDMVKDDQGLMDHAFCPFDERVARCAESVANGAAQRGRPCLYLPHISGPLDVMRRRAARAKKAGAGGLLVAPGLTGFDGLRALASDEALALPVASHPSFLGAYAAQAESGVAPAVLYGLLPRLAGADISIYPSAGAGYVMTQDDWLAIAERCRRPWGHVQATMPTAAGRMQGDRVPAVISLYGSDSMFILGSRIQQTPLDIVEATRQFVRTVEAVAG